MKKIISIFIITIVLGISSVALAEKPSVTIGLKTWIATWEEKFTGGSIESDYGLMYGPNITLRYGNFFGGLSYLMGGGFSFPTEELLGPLFGDIDTEADRTDLDLSVGYYFHPNVAVFLGYKTIDLDFTFDYIDLGGSETVGMEFNGPAFGVSVHYPIAMSKWVLFGSLGFVSLDGEMEGESLGDTSGPTLEFGGAYAVENIPLSISVGYKYQSYESDDAEDTFSGFTLGANYAF